MGVPKVLQRLLRVRSVEEEQRRRLLESAMTCLAALEQTRGAALETAKHGRALKRESVISGELLDRVGGLVEAAAAEKHACILAGRITTAKEDTVARRGEFLEKRMERQQAETLAEQATIRENMESDRRSQQMIDDWYGARAQREAAEENS